MLGFFLLLVAAVVVLLIWFAKPARGNARRRRGRS